MIEITITNDMPCADLAYPNTRVELTDEMHAALDEALDELFDTHARTHFTAKEIAKELGLPKKVLNRVLKNEGWQVKNEGEWRTTIKGFDTGKPSIDDGVIFWSYDAVTELLFSEE